MKHLSLFAISLFVISHLYAQDENWMTIATNDLGMDSARGGYVFITDVNNDFYPDIAFVLANTIKGQLKLYLNKQKPGSTDPRDRYFEDITEWSNITVKRNGEQGRIIDNAVFADIDNDGDVDVVTGIYYHRWEYYHPDSLDPGDRCEVMLNRGNGKFDLLENSGLNVLGPHSGKDQGLVNTSGMAFLDYDLDGNLDLFVASWFDDYKYNVYTPSYLLKGNGDGTFTDVSFETKIKTDKNPLYGVNVTDWNNDGYMDITTAPYCRSSGSLWKNQKDGTFKDVATEIGYNTQFLNGEGWGDPDMTYAKPLCAWAVQPADYDNDGDMDFFFTLVHGGFGNDVFGNECGHSTVVINHGATDSFKLEWATDVANRKPPRSSHLGDYDATWLDIDNDMLLDLAMGNGSYNNNTRLFILQQDNNNVLYDITRDLGYTGLKTMIRELYSLQPFDFDLDGDDDLLIAHGNGDYEPKNEILILENNIGEKNNWTGILLDAPKGCNKSAIGSRITVYAGGVAQTREIKAGFGHFSGQQPFITNFGLNKEKSIDSIVVRWQTNPITYTKVIHPPINEIIVIKKEGLWGNLGIENPEELDFILYPNPATNHLNIKFPPNYNEKVEYSIFDISGKLISNNTINTSSDFQLDISDFKSGYYIFSIKSNESAPKTVSFMVTK